MAGVEIWFEFASTYSYPAVMRVEEVARDAGVELVWRPFLLGPIFAAQAWKDSPFNIYPVKGRYMWRDLERICAARSLPLKRPSQFPRNGLLAARVATAAANAAWLPELVRRIYTASFAHDRDIAEPEVLLQCLQGLAPDPEAALAAAQDPDTKARLRAQTERAVALGIFGAPTFVVGEELFWGNDRLEAARDWALRAPEVG